MDVYGMVRDSTFTVTFTSLLLMVVPVEVCALALTVMLYEPGGVEGETLTVMVEVKGGFCPLGEKDTVKYG